MATPSGKERTQSANYKVECQAYSYVASSISRVALYSPTVNAVSTEELIMLYSALSAFIFGNPMILLFCLNDAVQVVVKNPSYKEYVTQHELMMNFLLDTDVMCGFADCVNSLQSPLASLNDSFALARTYLQSTVCYPTSYPIQLLKLHSNSSKFYANQSPTLLKEYSSLLSIILKTFSWNSTPSILANLLKPESNNMSLSVKQRTALKRKSSDELEATSISTTPADLEEAGADVDSSTELDLNEEDALAEYCTAKPSTKNSGLTGCSISLKRPDGSYSWRSTKYRANWDQYVDIKIYEDLKPLQAKDPKEQWKLAVFRGKMCIGNPTTPVQTRRLKAAIKELQLAMLEAAKTFPGVTTDLVRC